MPCASLRKAPTSRTFMTDPRFIDQSLLADLSAQAAASPRKRKNHNFHGGNDAPCHRLLNALEMDSYIQPHRHLHPDKGETLIVVRGKLGALCFDAQGRITHKAVIAAGGERIGLDTPAGVFHSFVALEPGSVIFEAKAGPYEPVSEAERAPWAPLEQSPEAPAYLAWMRAQFE